jgi:4a-hydroxytetrahydrobiopterin dehydratase
MAVETTEQLRKKKCLPCEGGVPKLSRSEAEQQIKQLEGWKLTRGGDWIEKKWTAKNFMAAMRFFSEVARVAEQEGHHPDLHLEGYRNARIEISTHAIGGLSENDFILAAKIDELPIELRKS